MSFSEQLPEWNNAGVEPPAGKKTDGWLEAEKPPAGWMNWLFRRAYKCLEELRTFCAGLAGAGRTTETVKGNADDVSALTLGVAAHTGDQAAGIHGSTSAATANKIAHRDAAGRSRFADPDHNSDAATKGWVDTQINDKARTRVAVLTAAGGIPKKINGCTQDFIEGTNHDFYVLTFAQSVDRYAFFHFALPPDYVAGNVTVKFFWRTSVTSGTARWLFRTLGRGSNVLWDSALGTEQNVQQSPSATANRVNIATFTAFNPGWAAGDAVIIRIGRNGAHANDNMAAAAQFLMAVIEYTGR